MSQEEEKIKYPQNIPLKGLVAVSGRTVKDLAEKIGVSRRTLSLTVNGHYKGDNVIPKLIAELELTQTDNNQNPQNHETI
jgi:DNA transposition AAA+ family ATPase